MIIKNAAVYQEDGVFQVTDLYIKKDRIVSQDSSPSSDEVLDATGLYAIPGLTDIHFHGCAGYDFCDATSQAIQAIADYELSQGITQICPATMTFPEEALLSISNAARLYPNTKGATLCGIHMEGPFLSADKKGAQKEEYLCTPDIAMFRRLQAASGNLYKIVDLAVEMPGAADFTAALQNEVLLSISHSEANYEQAMQAFDAGVRHVTHLYNAMTPYSHRLPGIVGAACDNASVHVELIGDGIHIHPSVIRNTFRMFTDERIILISDSMRATGLADGEYTLGGQAVTVQGPYATLADGTIAGSVTNLMDCVRLLVKQMQIPLESAIKCAAVNPAKEIGIYSDYGSLTATKKANIVLLDHDLQIVQIIKDGFII